MHWHPQARKRSTCSFLGHGSDPGHRGGGDYGSSGSPGPQQVGQLIPGLLCLAVLLMQQSE